MSFKFRKAGTKSSGKGHSPSEPCGMEVASNSVITLGIPFQTPRAKEIRECLHAKVINQDGQRIWIYPSTWAKTYLTLDELDGWKESRCRAF